MTTGQIAPYPDPMGARGIVGAAAYVPYRRLDRNMSGLPEEYP